MRQMFILTFNNASHRLTNISGKKVRSQPWVLDPHIQYMRAWNYINMKH